MSGFLNVFGAVQDVLKSLFGIIDKAVENKDEANKLKASLQEAMLKADSNEILALMQARAGIVTAEAQGESFLQRNWRPIIMLLMGVIMANNYIIAPYTNAFFGVNVMLPIPPDMWNLLQLGIGGYIVGRTGEKMVKTWKEGGK